jgi:hypothetical protein
LDPLPVPGALAPSAPQSAAPVSPSRDTAGITDVVDQWVSEHPGDFSGSDPARRDASPDLPPVVDTAPGVAVTDPTAAAPNAAAPSVDGSSDVADPSVPAAAGNAAAASDAPPAATTAPAQAAAPAAAAQPKVYDPAEKIALGEGAEWTRAQIIEGLQERSRLLPEVETAKAFRDIFDNQTPDQVRANLEPLFDAIRTNPEAARFADGVLFGSDPARLAYLQECAAAYDGVNPSAATNAPATRVVAPGAQPQRAPQQNERDRQIAELVAWKQQRERQDGIDRVNREWSQATSRYPVLATDATLRRLVGARAAQLFDANPQHGLLEALGEFRSLIEATQIASAQGAPAPAAAPIVPAVLGGTGATPTPSGPAAVRSEPKVDLNNVVDDWIANESPKFR